MTRYDKTRLNWLSNCGLDLLHQVYFASFVVRGGLRFLASDLDFSVLHLLHVNLRRLAQPGKLKQLVLLEVKVLNDPLPVHHFKIPLNLL